MIYWKGRVPSCLEQDRQRRGQGREEARGEMRILFKKSLSREEEGWEKKAVKVA
jgi:hypothetical protein